MKLKLPALLVCLVLSVCQCYAQRENVYYFKNSGAKVDHVDSADYVRVVRETEYGKKMYDVLEYYKNEQPKSVGKSTQVDPLVYEGTVVQYYPTGKKKEIINYTKGKRSGEYYRYFPNGKIYLHAIYNPEATPEMEYLLFDCVDSTGNVTVKEGVGRYIGYDDDFKNILEQGEIKGGQRTGKWTGATGTGNGALNYTEEYDGGKLISGVSVDEFGNSYQYTQRQVQPVFKGGLPAFGKFLAEGMRYPKHEKDMRIQGRVVVSFVVKPDGSLDDFKVIQNPNDQLTAEAIRMLKASPKWKPGVFYGKVVRVSYTVPIAFTL